MNDSTANKPAADKNYLAKKFYRVFGSMGIAQTRMKQAVESGYWHLFRFDPRIGDEGKNPFIMDSKAPISGYQEFIKSEVRYTSLERTNPERAARLFGNAEKYAKDKYDHLVRLSKLYEV